MSLILSSVMRLTRGLLRRRSKVLSDRGKHWCSSSDREKHWCSSSVREKHWCSSNVREKHCTGVVVMIEKHWCSSNDREKHWPRTALNREMFAIWKNPLSLLKSTKACLFPPYLSLIKRQKVRLLLRWWVSASICVLESSFDPFDLRQFIKNPCFPAV